MDALILTKLKELVERTPKELLTNPKTERGAAFEYGRAVGIVEGLNLALAEAEAATRQEDDG